MSIEAGGDERDRDMRTPTPGAFDTGAFDPVGGKQFERSEVAGGGVRVAAMDEPDTVGVNDADSEGLLVRVDARDGWCHHGVGLRW